MKLEELLCLLEKRLAEHDNNRKEVQSKLQKVCTEITKRADSLEKKFNGELQNSFNETEERVLTLVEKFNSNENRIGVLITQAQRELSTEVRYEVQHIEKAYNFIGSYKLKTTRVTKEIKISTGSSIECVINELQNHLTRIRESMTAAQDKLTEICTAERNRAGELEKKIIDKLEPLFTQEDARLQKAVNMIKENASCDNPEEQEKLVTQAKAALLVKQKYVLDSPPSTGECTLVKYDLTVVKEASLEAINIEERRPTNFTVSHTNKEGVSVSFTLFSDEEMALLIPCKLSLKAMLSFREKGTNASTGKTLTKEFSLGEEKLLRFSYSFPVSTTYLTKIKIKCDNRFTQWSEETGEFTTPEFNECCVWKECPENIDISNKYSLKNGSMCATKIEGHIYEDTYRNYMMNDDDNGCSCTIIGDTPIPSNKVTSWHIRIAYSRNDGKDIYVGVAPPSIDKTRNDNYQKCGWYFDCHCSSLWSGPPHNYICKNYGPRKINGEYVHTGDKVGVIMDTMKRKLSFALKGVEHGVAFEGIPLDKPLVPCAIICWRSDSVELVL